MNVYVQLPGDASAHDSLRFVASLLPVLLGATIAFCSTWWFARRAERFRRRSLGYALVLRANEAFNNVKEIERVLVANLSKVGSTPHITHKWQVVQIATGFDWNHSISFAPEELAILADGRKYDELNDLGELSRLHNILHIIMGEYVSRREALTTELRAASMTTVEGTQIQSWVDAQAVGRLEPDMMLVEDLLGQLIDKAVEGAAFAQGVVTRLGPAVKSALRDKEFRLRVDAVGAEETEVKLA